VLIAQARIRGEKTTAVLQSNTRSNIKVAKPQTFNGKVEKILDFLIVCKYYIRMKIRDTVVEKQVQWYLS